MSPCEEHLRHDVLIIGLGNPILGDDGVGWRVAQRVSAVLGSREGVQVDCLSVGGLALMERMLGHSRAIVVDAIDSGAAPEGTLSTFPLVEMTDPTLGHSGSAHDASLLTALQAAAALGASTPARVDVVAIETRTCLDFSEKLSAPIEAAIPGAIEKVLQLLER